MSDQGGSYICVECSPEMPCIDCRIDQWHNAPDDGVPLHEFLGMTWEQYKAWV